MSTTTRQTQLFEALQDNWPTGTVCGAVAALVMGGLMLAMNDAVLAVAIPSLYGLAPPATPAVGMAVHLFHGAVLGVVFAGIVGAVGTDSTGKLVGLGVGWGVVTWAVLAALVMPVWLSAVGSPASPPFPNFAPPSLLWHVVYGLVLGGMFAATEDWF